MLKQSMFKSELNQSMFEPSMLKRNISDQSTSEALYV